MKPDEADLSESDQIAKLIAFYLPQFHPIPENDLWWGRGFTEWRNVMRARPLFPGHYQPHVPSELGFYDLRVPEVREAQAELAREYGIHGFCYYHYWFQGRRLLERPFEDVLNSKSPDFPFALCWANEPWTRNWDARTGQVLVPQTYTREDDLAHIHWLIKAFSDPRYIKIDGRPLMLVYRARQLTEPKQTTDLWRTEAQKAGFPDLYLAKVESHGDDDDPAVGGFDASVGFFPASATKLLEPYSGFRSHTVLDYASAARSEMARPAVPYKRFPSVLPAWDNTARRKSGAIIFNGSTPELYEEWLRATVESVKHVRSEENLVFIVAWNEWAEGNHLEPDERYGRRYLEATWRAINPRGAALRLPEALPALSESNEPETTEPDASDDESTDYSYIYSYSEGTAPSQIVGLTTELIHGGGTIVDLGAGAGNPSRPLRDRGFRYHGMDVHPDAIRIMQKAGVDASWCDLSDPDSVIESLDKVDDVRGLLLIDVLEHLIEPQALLSRLSEWACKNDHPYLFISVPNVANFDVGFRLLLGRWDPTKTGLLDSTHVRFFYRKTLRRLCERSGWKVVEERDLHVVHSDQFSPELIDSVPPSVVGALQVLSDHYNPDATVQQYIWALSPMEASTYPASYYNAVEDDNEDEIEAPNDDGTDMGGPEAYRAVENYMESIGIFSYEVYRRQSSELETAGQGAKKTKVLAQLLAETAEAIAGEPAYVDALNFLAERFVARDDLQVAFGPVTKVNVKALLNWGIMAQTYNDYEADLLDRYVDAYEAIQNQMIEVNLKRFLPDPFRAELLSDQRCADAVRVVAQVYVDREELQSAFGSAGQVDWGSLLAWASDAAATADPIAPILGEHLEGFSVAKRIVDSHNSGKPAISAGAVGRSQAKRVVRGGLRRLRSLYHKLG